MKNSFHARFMKAALISYFTVIDRKRETNGDFRSVLPMKEPRKSMKRRLAKIQALVSGETALVSPYFMFRFTAISAHVYEVRPRKDRRSVDLIFDALPFGPAVV